MYKATIRALLRHSVKKLNAGDYSMLLKMASPSSSLPSPATIRGPPRSDRYTEAGSRTSPITGSTRQLRSPNAFVSEGIQFHIEDIVVNGGRGRFGRDARPRLRSAIDGGDDVYNNRVVAFLEIRWGPARAVGGLRGHATRRRLGCPNDVRGKSRILRSERRFRDATSWYDKERVRNSLPRRKQVDSVVRPRSRCGLDVGDVAGAGVLRIATWNVNSLKSRAPAIGRLIDRARPDVLLLQETKATDVHPTAQAVLDSAGYHIAHVGNGQYNGVAIAALAPLRDVVRSGEFGDERSTRNRE
jgi:hypothetical protein